MTVLEWFKSAEINIPADKMNQLEVLVSEFLDINTKINLSAIRDEAGVWKKHIIDSLLVTKHIDIDGKVLDLGTGGGFPSLPLAIISRSASILGLDSVEKKLKAVQSIADTIGIENLQTLHARAEDAAHDKYFRERFDYVVTRAVAPWPTLLELTLPFVKIGGRFVAYQGPAIEADIKLNKNIEHKLGAKILKIHRDSLFGEERLFVEMKKIRPTPSHYPRAVGIPKKTPLQ